MDVPEDRRSAVATNIGRPGWTLLASSGVTNGAFEALPGSQGDARRPARARPP